MAHSHLSRQLACQLPRLGVLSTCSTSSFSTSSVPQATHNHKLVIVGGGCGGTAVAHSFANRLGNGQTAVIEPSKDHFYQPLWTLVGGGLKKFDQSRQDTGNVLPKSAVWYQEKAQAFDPDNNSVTLANGDVLNYEYLVVAMGIQLRYDMIPGLEDALANDPRVCSNYQKDYVKKTFPALEAFQSGNAIFTFPSTPIKCAGAPQKICYLADDYFRKVGKRDQAEIMYNTSLPVIFGIPRYAEALMKIIEKRNIKLNKRTNLIEVKHDKGEAVFELMDEPGKTVTYNYDFLHVSPPCSPVEAIRDTKLVDATNFVDVDRETLQHKTYSNVFAIGDCTNAPTAKTAAAVASQSGVVKTNLDRVMNGQEPVKKYDGYTSCPLVTSSKTCILAEFGFDGAVLETFPIAQNKERFSMYLFKAEIFPRMYWLMLIRGLWFGPKLFRKLFSLGTKA